MLKINSTIKVHLNDACVFTTQRGLGYLYSLPTCCEICITSLSFFFCCCSTSFILHILTMNNSSKNMQCQATCKKRLKTPEKRIVAS